MLKDKERHTAFQRAINKVVKVGDIVLDLGAGIGIMGFYALKAGAKRIYLVEPTSLLNIAREIASDNDFENRTVFINTPSWEAQLDDDVDVIICEMFGIFGLEENIIKYLGDVRDRFLKPEGILIPKSVELFLVPIQSSECHEMIEFCDSPDYQVNISQFKKMTANNIYKAYLTPQDFLSTPEQLCKIDFDNTLFKDGIIIEEDFTFEITKDGILHGLLGWFDAMLANGIKLSTSPYAPQTHWLQAYMPSIKPVIVRKRDILETKIIGVSIDKVFIWNWQGELNSKPIFNHTSRFIPDFPFKRNRPLIDE